MKSQFNTYNGNKMNIFEYLYEYNMKNITTRSCNGQIRSKLIDLPTIYSSGPKVGSLGR